MGLKEICEERALFAREKLQENNNGVCGIKSAHKNPLNGIPCDGDIVIKFGSWGKAVNSAAMNEFGIVGGICASCGYFGYLDSQQLWVE